MAKRELPPRSTRGQRLTQNEELEKQDDRLYEQLFGKNVTEDQQDDD